MCKAKVVFRAKITYRQLTLYAGEWCHLIRCKEAMDFSLPGLLHHDEQVHFYFVKTLKTVKKTQVFKITVLLFRYSS